MTRKIEPCCRCGRDVVVIDSDKIAVWCMRCIKEGLEK